MPRFNAAKSWKKLDDDLSGKFNYLCDLLDEGYSSVALINNHEIAIYINPKDGIKIVNDGNSIFSLDPLTGEIVIGKYDSSVASLIASLGDMAYEDAVEVAKLGSTVIDGGYIKTGLIDASRIDTGTLNAARVAIGSTSTYSAGYNPSQKRRVFTATPTTPYDVGDLWSGGPTGDLKKCKTARASGAYVASDWELASKYTDDSSVAGLIASLGDMAYEDAVEAAKLGSTVIDGGYIKTGLIDASRIDTGTLNAARIAASSITFDKLASAAVTSITDTIDLGGRNLLKNSDKDVTNSSYSLTSYTWANVSDMVQGEKYTITIEGTLPAGLSWYINVYAQDPTAYPALAYLYDSDKVSANKWVKTVTMPTLASGQSFTGQTNLYQFPLGGGQTVSVTRIKIERGNKATDWTPAPEDKLSEGVSYAGVEIDATNGLVSTATIGGKEASFTTNATKIMEYLFDGKKRFGVDANGYVYANRLYDPDDTSAYVQIGAVSGETGRSALTLYQQTSGYTAYRPRLRLKSYGTTAFTIEGIVKPSGTDVEGTGALSITHGTSQLSLSQTLDMAKLISSSKGLGVKSSGPYYQPDTAVAAYNDLWHEGNVDFATGSGTSSSTAGGDTSVSFGKTFASAPVVCANTTGANSYTCRIKSVSKTGFVLVVSGASIGFNYIAVAM